MNNAGIERRLAIGKMKEEEFKKLFSKTIAPSVEEDMHEHWDFKTEIKIDVKGMKKKSRSQDAEPDENIHWIELKNVMGRLGWLYGEADFFAFETKKYWVVVDKLKLQQWVAKNIVKEMKPTPTLNHLYNRATCKDVINLVYIHDLYYLSEVVIAKL